MAMKIRIILNSKLVILFIFIAILLLHNSDCFISLIAKKRFVEGFLFGVLIGREFGSKTQVRQVYPYYVQSGNYPQPSYEKYHHKNSENLFSSPHLTSEDTQHNSEKYEDKKQEDIYSSPSIQRNSIKIPVLILDKKTKQIKKGMYSYN